MKKKLTAILTLVLVSTLTFFACANTPKLKDNPIITESIISNGGMSVQKGDYLYYINGTTSSKELKAGQNKWGDWSHAGIYRTKLNDNQEISYTNEGFVEKTELVVSKIVGYENGSFYILGDYIYFSTPNNQKNSSGESLTSLTDIYRVNLNGTGETKLYTTYAEDLTAKDWTMKMVNNDHYLVIKDNQDLVSIKTNGKVANKNIIATGVSSFGLTHESTIVNNFNQEVNKVNNYVYYTRAITSDDNHENVTGNIFARSSFVTVNEEVLKVENGTSFNVIDVKNNSVYYTKTKKLTENITPLFASRINLESDNRELVNEMQLTSTKYDNIKIIEYQSPSAVHHVLANKNNTIFLITNNGDPKPILTDENIIISLSGSLLLTNAEGGFKVIDVLNTKNVKEYIQKDKPLANENASQVDFDGRFIFVPVEYTAEDKTNHKYLNRIDTTSNKPEFKFVGKMEKDHLPEKPDNSELPEDEWVLWIK